jgi:hypothetical protein
VAQMLCANTHGVLTIMQLSSLPTAPRGWALAMIRRVFAECHSLGIIGYMAFLTDTKKPERRLMTIVSRAGGYLIPTSGAWAVGRLETRY